MKTAIFRLIDKINRDGMDNGNWGVVEDIKSTKEYFGTDRDEQLNGQWLYVYIDNDDKHSTIIEYLYECRERTLLKTKWFRTDQPNIFIVLTKL